MVFSPCFFYFLCFSFFLLWYGSLWCDWIESSVQDSQWGNCTDGNWWSLHHVILVLGHSADLCHVSCCAESTCGSAKDTQRNREKHYDYICLSASFPLIKQAFFMLHNKPSCTLHFILNAMFDIDCLLIFLTFEHHHYPEPINSQGWNLSVDRW